MSRVEVEKKVLNENQILAEQLRERYREHGVLCVNLISSPGSGKTLLLEKTLERMDKGTRVAVLTGDLQTENDAQRLAKYGFPVKQIVTGGTCHLDARMVEKHLADWKLEDLDLLIVENVGNLVCPSSYDLGEDAKIVLLSTTEGEDKPLKYPSIFFKSELMVLTKIDLLPYVPFKAELARENARRVHPGMEILELSSTTGEGLDAWMNWLEARRAKAKAKADTGVVCQIASAPQRCRCRTSNCRLPSLRSPHACRRLNLSAARAWPTMSRYHAKLLSGRRDSSVKRPNTVVPLRQC